MLSSPAVTARTWVGFLSLAILGLMSYARWPLAAVYPLTCVKADIGVLLLAVSQTPEYIFVSKSPCRRRESGAFGIRREMRDQNARIFQTDNRCSEEGRLSAYVEKTRIPLHRDRAWRLNKHFRRDDRKRRHSSMDGLMPLLWRNVGARFPCEKVSPRRWKCVWDAF